MTKQQKLDNYKNYVDGEVEMERVPMSFECFIESLLADACETCCKCGETVCGNDTEHCSCWESK